MTDVESLLLSFMGASLFFPGNSSDLPMVPQCRKYDVHMAAENILEAIKHFPDLTLPSYMDDAVVASNSSKGANQGELDLSGLNLQEFTGSPSDPDSCRSTACKACSSMLIERLRAVGMIGDAEKQELERKLNTKGVADREKKCHRVSADILEEQPSQNQHSHRRQKRNVHNDDDIVGHREVIRSVKQGKLIDRNSPWISLCDIDWTFRKLPDGYIPRWHNELIQTGDGKCLSGYGRCRQMYHNMDVTEKTKDGSIMTRTIRVARAVSCVVTSDSEAYDLARGVGAAALPRL